MPKGTKGVSNREDNYQCVEYYIKRNPGLSIEECEELRKSRIKKSISTRPDNSGKNNPAHKSKTTESERKRRSAMCIEYWQWKHPELSLEEQQKLLEDHRQRIKSKLRDKSNQPKCVEYWLKKGYSKAEARRIISKSQETFSLRKCIERYGEDEGLKVFEDRQRRWQKSLHDSFVTTNRGIIQSRWTLDIIERLRKDVSELETEYLIDRFSFDIRYRDRLIELNGDYWHCNPKLYDANFKNKSNNLFARDIWKRDSKKIKVANKLGFQVLTIWESDCNEDLEQALQKCINFLNG